MRERVLFKPFLPIILLICFLTGCIGFQAIRPEKHSYMLDASRHLDVASPARKASLKVRRFRVSPQYEGKGFVYRKGALDFETDFYNEFFAPPSTMLTEEVREWLAGSGLFHHVVDTSSTVETLYTLEGELTALYGDYREKKAPKAVLKIQFSLIRDVSDRPEMVFQRQYHEQIPLKADTPQALVEAWNEGFQRILAAFENDLRAEDLLAGM